MHNYEVKYSGMYNMPYFLTPIPKHRTESQDIIYHTPAEEKLLALHDDPFFYCSSKPFIIQFCLKNKRLLEV